MQIKDCVFLVTGGASGLGKATCEEIVKRGGYVTVMDCNAAGEQVVAELGERALWPGTVDVTSEADVLRAIQQTKERFGAIHGAVNSAGITKREMLLSPEGEPHSYDSFKRMIDINLGGPFNVMRLVAAEMIKQEPVAEGERGVFLNVSSLARTDGLPSVSAYTASKAGLSSLSLVLARELGIHGIRVFDLTPGMFDTPMVAGVGSYAYAPLFVYPNRMGHAHEFAQLAVACIENKMINGVSIDINGGASTVSPIRAMFYQPPPQQ